LATTVTVALPTWPAASVKVSLPSAPIVGSAAKRSGFPWRSVFVTSKWTVWVASFGPGEIDVAHGWSYVVPRNP